MWSQIHDEVLKFKWYCNVWFKININGLISIPINENINKLLFECIMARGQCICYKHKANIVPIANTGFSSLKYDFSRKRATVVFCRNVAVVLNTLICNKRFRKSYTTILNLILIVNIYTTSKYMNCYLQAKLLKMYKNYLVVSF